MDEPKSNFFVFFQVRKKDLVGDVGLASMFVRFEFCWDLSQKFTLAHLPSSVRRQGKVVFMNDSSDKERKKEIKK